jgi:radical SAM superfamily enzyme YgiQ (UPF0313 family)
MKPILREKQLRALLITYDNGSYIHYFPLGVAYIASILRNQGVEVEIYSQDVNHYSEEHLTKILDYENYDMVGIGTVAGYYPYRKLIKIAEAINASVNRQNFRFIISGHMVSASPELMLYKTKADVAVVGEGEETIKELVQTGFQEHRKIKGTVWRIHDCIYTNEPRELIENLDVLPFPAYDLFPMEYYRLQRLPHIEPNEFSASVITGRGCSFHCTFCYRLMEGIRLRSVHSIANEIRWLQQHYRVSYIDFADDLTMVSKARTKELCEALEPLKIKWRCEGRLNYADIETLEMMKKAGCVFINYGIESLDDTVLKNMKKALTEQIIIQGVENTLEVGISPGLNIIWGNVGDDIDTLQKSVEFLLKYDDGSQIRTIRPVTPYPGCELFNLAKKKGLVIDEEDFYENKHLNSDLITCNFTNISDNECYNALYSANLQLLSKYSNRQLSNIEDMLKKLYLERDTSFRGFRQT